MTKDELIAKQQLEIESLKRELDGWEETRQIMHNQLYGIGAPLNDNVLNFSKEQLKWFFNISGLFDPDQCDKCY